MEPGSIKDWLELHQAIFAWLCSFGGVALLLRRHITQAFHNHRFVCELRAYFGQDSVSTIIALLDYLKTGERERHQIERILTASLQIGIYRCSPDGKCEMANEWLCRAFGLSEKQMMGTQWLQAIAPEDRDAVEDKWLRAVKLGSPYEAEYTVTNQATGRTWRATTKVVLIKEDDVPLFYLGFVRPKTLKWDSDPAEPIRHED